MRLNRKGFTLIELVMIIVILGILAAVAIPRYVSMQGEAKIAAEKGVVGGVRAGIMTYFAKNKAWPTTLTTTTIFDEVLTETPDDWTQSGTTYTGPGGGSYTYDNTNGSFK